MLYELVIWLQSTVEEHTAKISGMIKCYSHGKRVTLPMNVEPLPLDVIHADADVDSVCRPYDVSVRHWNVINEQMLAPSEFTQKYNNTAYRDVLRYSTDTAI